MLHLTNHSGSSSRPLRSLVSIASFGALSFFLLALTNTAVAQPGVTYVTNQSPVGVTWNFNDTAAWSGGVVPPDSSSIFIVDAKMNLNLDNRVFGVVSIGTGLYIGLRLEHPHCYGLPQQCWNFSRIIKHNHFQLYGG